MPVLRRPWLVGAAVVGAAALALAIPDLARAVTAPYGALVALVGVAPLVWTVASRARRRGARAVLVLAGVGLVVGGGLLARRDEFLDLELALISWRILVRSPLALAPVGLVVVGIAIALTAVGALRDRRRYRTAGAWLAGVTALGAAGVTAAASVVRVRRDVPLFVDEWGLVTAGVLTAAAVLLAHLGLATGRADPAGLGGVDLDTTTGAPGAASAPEVAGASRRRLRLRRAVAAVTVLGVAGAAGAWWWQTRGPRFAIEEVFPDDVLAVCVATALDRAPSDRVSERDLANLRTLACAGTGTGTGTGTAPAAAGAVPAAAGARVEDLTGLDRLTNLATLDLADNRVRDLAPLSGLANLSSVKLTGNEVADLTALAGLPVLTELGMSGNAVSDLSPLAQVPTLRWLGLGGNRIAGVGPLANLTGLAELDLTGNTVTDITPLANLPELQRLTLADNRVADPSPLGGLPLLTMLDLRRNVVADATTFTGFPALSELWLGENPVTDVTALAALPALLGVDVEGLDPATPGLDVLRERGVYVGSKA
ncbi:leucine-rich repeat domain-containing protein [Georgenia yuyongxinii]